MKQFFYLVLLVLCCGSSASAQMRVTGTVTGAEDGKPVAFASVTVKKMTTATTTGEDGSYSITVPDGNATLVFNFFGMKSYEEVVGGRNVINVSLENEAFTIEETMVVAYGVVKKSTFTGSAAVLKADKIKDMPVSSFQDALAGQVAGLQFAPGSGQAGSTSNIRIRGIGSLNASNEPLYVVDGIPIVSGNLTQIGNISNNVMSTLNPNDIESLTVLKDAAASALYGSRAANGVIIITTKKGAQGKPKVSLRATMGFTPDYAFNNFPTATPEQQEILVYEHFYNEYIDKGLPNPDVYAQGKLDFFLPKDPRGYFDWEGALFRTGVYQSYDASVSGGNEGTTYYTSVSYMKEKGRSIRNEMKRYSGRINLSQKISKMFEVGTNINVSKTAKEGFSDNRAYDLNDYYAVKNLLMPQYWPTDLDGNPVTSRYGSFVYNKLYYGNLDTRTSDMLKTSASGNISVNIIDGLTFKTIFSYDATQVEDYWWGSPLHHNSGSTGGDAANYSVKYEKLVSSNTLSYNKTFKEDHSISVLAGYEAEENNTYYKMASGKGFPNTTSTTVATTGTKDANAYDWGYNMLSYLSKADYNYKNRYFVSGSFRRDGSSRFGTNSRWGNFWSVSASWRAKAESFLQDANWLDDLRVKLSYGVNGTLPTSNYDHIALYSFGSAKIDNTNYYGNYNGIVGGFVSNSPDPNLTWESNYTWNIALEARIFNILSINFEVYNRDSKDLLQRVPLSRTTGFSTQLRNFGEMNNKGFDLELRADILKHKDWNWNAGLNVSYVKSKITKLYDGEDVGNDLFIFREGYSPNSYYVREWAGVDPQTGAAQWYKNTLLSDGSYDKTIVNNRTDAEYILYDKAEPDVYGGFFTGVSWKDISLNLGFTYSFGGLSYDNTANDNQDDGYYNARIMSRKQWERWTTPGQITNTPRRTYDQNTGQGYQSRKLHSSDHIRLKTITLSYSLPKNILSKVYISNARVFISGTNLFTWAKYKEYDPEVGVRGIRGWEMPLGKTYTFGVEIDF